jgi:hypothetical protein
MKTAEIEQILMNRGYEQGVRYILMALNEENRTLRKSITELALMLDKMIDTMNNVVEGAGAMKREHQAALRKAGLAEPEDDMGASTHMIGEQ